MMFTGKPKAGRIGHAVIRTATLFRRVSCYIMPLHYCRMLMSGHGFMYAIFDCEIASCAVSVVKGIQFCYFLLTSRVSSFDWDVVDYFVMGTLYTQ
jgi:hypothetical protein